MALCPECALNVSIPVTYTRDRCAYVVDCSLATVESTAVGRQGPEVRILSPRPFILRFSRFLSPLPLANSHCAENPRSATT